MYLALLDTSAESFKYYSKIVLLCVDIIFVRFSLFCTSPPFLRVLDPCPSCRVPARRRPKKRPPRIAFHPTEMICPSPLNLE